MRRGSRFWLGCDGHAYPDLNHQALAATREFPRYHQTPACATMIEEVGWGIGCPSSVGQHRPYLGRFGAARKLGLQEASAGALEMASPSGWLAREGKAISTTDGLVFQWREK
jgi:hypothetical protein